MNYEKTQPSKQDKTNIEEKIKQMEESNLYDIYIDEKTEKYIELITNAKLGDKISYISYIEKDETIKYRSGGFLSNNKKDIPYFVLRSSVPFNRAKFLTFPVQYKNLRGLMIKKEQVHLSKKDLKKDVKEEVIKEAVEKEREKLTEEIREELNKKRRETGRHSNFFIYIDDEFHKSFQDKHQRLKYTQSKKFKELSKDKEVTFKFLKNDKVYKEQ